MPPEHREDAPGGASQPPRISACIISFNEESCIRACLDSVAWCDEIVVVDSHSEDRTVEIAREAGARVISQSWLGHVAQKNHALEAARGDWVIALDCDERVTGALRQRIEALLRGDAGREPGCDGYAISRKLFYLGRWLEHGGWFPEWRIRLFHRGRARWVGIDPHDTVSVSGRVGRIAPGGDGEDAAVILHHSFRDLSHQLKVLDRYTAIQAGELHQRGRRARLLDLVLRPFWRFVLCYVLRAGFLDGLPGFHMAVNHAYAAYMKYARLWELERGLTDSRSSSGLAPTRDEDDGGDDGGSATSRETEGRSA